jgi:hypothetical protein
MTSFTKRRISFLTGLLLSTCLAGAQVPSGLVDFSFDTPTARVFDLSGSLAIEQQMIGAGDQETPLSFPVDVTQDSNGKLSGSGVTVVNVGNDFVAGNYKIKGKVSGGGNSVNRASFTVKLTGQDTIAGVPNTKFSISLEYKLEADSEEGALFGSARGSANFSGFSSANIHSDIAIGLAPGMDGTWSVEMNILALKKLGGSAVITLSNQRALQTRLSGSYSTHTAVAKIKLKGFDASKGTSANLDFISSEEGIELQKLRGKILGQSVRDL